MTLTYSQQTSEILEIEEMLRNLSLAFKVELDQDLTKVSLLDGDKTIVGYAPILAHLEELKGELHQWYYCAC